MYAMHMAYIPQWRLLSKVRSIYVYIYTYICVCVYTHMYIHICIYTHVAYRRQCIPNIQNTFRNDASSARYTSIYTSIYIYVCVYVYIHICTYTYVYTHMNIHICIYTYTHVAYRQQCIPKIQNTFRNDASSATYAQYTSIYIYICVCMCTYTYVHTHMYIHICIYTYVTYRVQCMPCIWHTFRDGASAKLAS